MHGCPAPWARSVIGRLQLVHVCRAYACTHTSMRIIISSHQFGESYAVNATKILYPVKLTENNLKNANLFRM